MDKYHEVIIAGKACAVIDPIGHLDWTVYMKGMVHWI